MLVFGGVYAKDSHHSEPIGWEIEGINPPRTKTPSWQFCE